MSRKLSIGIAWSVRSSTGLPTKALVEWLVRVNARSSSTTRGSGTVLNLQAESDQNSALAPACQGRLSESRTNLVKGGGRPLSPCCERLGCAAKVSTWVTSSLGVSWLERVHSSRMSEHELLYTSMRSPDRLRIAMNLGSGVGRPHGKGIPRSKHMPIVLMKTRSLSIASCIELSRPPVSLRRFIPARWAWKMRPARLRFRFSRNRLSASAFSTGAMAG